MAQFDTYPKLLNGIERILARDDLKDDIASVPAVATGGTALGTILLA